LKHVSFAANGCTRMPRVDLWVPFSEKDEACRLGARWDVAGKVWFVPANLDATAFARWLPVVDHVNIRASGYFVASTRRDCWNCERTTAVHGFALPAGHEVLWVGGDPTEDCWEVADEPSIVFYLDWLAAPIVARMRERTRHYRIGYSATLDDFYWMNRCEHCGTKLGDHDTYCEPGQAFMPFSPEEAALITLTGIDEPFAAGCRSYSIGIEYFVYMRRA
jgi:hypothetical protein